MIRINEELDIYFPLKFKPRAQQIEMFNMTKHSINNGKKFVLLNAPTGSGKAQPLYSKILTPTGFKQLGELKHDDNIITPSGNISKIIQLHEIEKLPIYRLTFADGRSVECTENHLWKVYSHDWESVDFKILKLKDVLEKFNKNIKRQSKDNRLRIHIPLISNDIKLPDVNLPIDPYLFGCLVGDGGFTQNLSFTSCDEHIINKLNDICDKYDTILSKQSGKYAYLIIRKNKKIKFNPLMLLLREMNLMGKKSENKFIPDIYKKSSYMQKIELIRGLMDTDGGISKMGNIEYSSSSYQLIKDLQEIIWSIGGYAKITEKKGNYKYKIPENKKKHYRLTIRFQNPELLFTLPKKLERVPKNYQYKNLKLRIDDIELIGETDTRCITINDPEQLYITDNYVVTHNSYYSLMLANWYRNYVNSNAKFDIITNSKLLQQQYKDEFDFINDLRGQSNYKCRRHNTDCRTGKEMNKATKQLPCPACPYDIAREDWVDGSISLTNFHLYNSFAFYVQEILLKRSANVLIVDEAHDFESVFCDYISVKLSPKILKNYGIEDQVVEMYQRRFADIKTAGGFINFIEKDFIPYIGELKSEFESMLGDAPNDKLKQAYLNYIIYIENAEEKFDGLLKDFSINENNWTLDITKSKLNEIELNMQPIWGNVYLNEVIWDRYDHVIFMSGSILDKNMFSYLNGFNEELTDYYELDSTFPVKNRPLYYVETGKMTYDQREKTFQKQVVVIEKILKKYNNDRGIIHTTNYEIAKWLRETIKDKRLIYHETENREEQLDKMKNKKNGIIVSPSMVSGISLDDDLSRFQILMKVPYPNISSNKIKARQTSNKKWYVWRTIVDIVQAYGRSTRSETDWSHTFILDSSFGDLLRYNRKMMPNYFVEAIKILK